MDLATFDYVNKTGLKRIVYNTGLPSAALGRACRSRRIHRPGRAFRLA
jgi:hypothetical protein